MFALHGTTQARFQGAPSASPRLPSPPRRASQRRTVLLKRVLRCGRPRASQVRDVAPGPCGWTLGQPERGTLRAFATRLLSSPESLRVRWATGLRRLAKARPNKPAPNRPRVPGSGTENSLTWLIKIIPQVKIPYDVVEIQHAPVNFHQVFQEHSYLCVFH